MRKLPESFFSRIARSRETSKHEIEVTGDARPPLIPLSLIMLLFLLNCVVGFAFLEEDAFIDFRYVINVAEGFGFVFNPGGEQVEGFSNFLWFGILYFSYVSGLEVITAARIIGIILGLGTIYMSCKACIRVTGHNGPLNLLPAAMIAFSPPLIYWYQGGLEPALFSVLLLGVLYLHLEESRRVIPFPLSGMVCLLLALTRPEGILFFVLLAILKTPPAMRDNQRLRSYITFFFSCFLPFLFFIAVRYSTFHSIVPNTFYAKVNYPLPDALRIGGLYTLAFMSDSRAWFLLIPFIPVLFRTGGEARWRNLLPLIIFIAYMVFVLYVGGDFHIYFRFYAPLLPLFFIMCASGLWEIHGFTDERFGRVFANILTTLLALVILFGITIYHRSPAWRDLEMVNTGNRSLISYRYQRIAANPAAFGESAHNWIKPPGDILDITGKWLAEEYPEDTRLATEQCGKVPYYTQFETYDLLGLNDKETARIIHHGRSFDQYLARFNEADDDIVVLYYADGRFVDQLHIGKLVESIEFQQAYELNTVLEFDYIYNLDQQYHRERYILLFERRETPVEIETPLKADGMLGEFIENVEAETGNREFGVYEETDEAPVVKGKRRIQYVIEL